MYAVLLAPILRAILERPERRVLLFIFSGIFLGQPPSQSSPRDFPRNAFPQKPRGNQFRVEILPYFGTGKLDLRRMKEITVEAAVNEVKLARLGERRAHDAGIFRSGEQLVLSAIPGTDSVVAMVPGFFP
jgi:hypothetical protein